MDTQDKVAIKKAGRISLSLALLILLFAACLVTLYVLTTAIVQHKAIALDDAAFRVLGNMVSPGMTRVMLAITFFGSQYFLLPANVILILVVTLNPSTRRRAWKLAVVAITSTAVLFLLKDLLHRNRPLVPLIAKAHHYSFPSGHMFTSFTFFGMVAWLLYKSKLPNWKWILIILIACLVMGIGISRVYLKLHFMSDVVAGACLGFVWLVLSRWVLNYFMRARS